jgi:hypothetical protein
MRRAIGLVGVAAAFLAALTPATTIATSAMQSERTTDHPCAAAQTKRCYGVVITTTVPNSQAQPMTTGRRYVTRQASYQEYGYDYPNDLLYTVTLEAEFWYDGSSAGVVSEHPQCDAEGGVKQWSCTSTKSGDQWDPGRYGGASTAWADFVTEFHYPCPVCSEVNNTYVRLWETPTNQFYHYAGH